VQRADSLGQSLLGMDLSVGDEPEGRPELVQEQHGATVFRQPESPADVGVTIANEVHELVPEGAFDLVAIVVGAALLRPTPTNVDVAVVVDVGNGPPAREARQNQLGAKHGSLDAKRMK